MSDVKKLAPFIRKWEGGFVDDPLDAGGATNKGVTIGTFINYCRRKGLEKPTVERLKYISDTEWTEILKEMYWDRWKADKIESQSVANILVDWVWASGYWGIKIPQVILGVDPDGKVGRKTLAALNDRNAEELFYEIQEARKAFVYFIVARSPSQVRFKRGWLNRINDLKFNR